MEPRANDAAIDTAGTCSYYGASEIGSQSVTVSHAPDGRLLETTDAWPSKRPRNMAVCTVSHAPDGRLLETIDAWPSNLPRNMAVCTKCKQAKAGCVRQAGQRRCERCQVKRLACQPANPQQPSVTPSDEQQELQIDGQQPTEQRPCVRCVESMQPCVRLPLRKPCAACIKVHRTCVPSDITPESRRYSSSHDQSTRSESGCAESCGRCQGMALHCVQRQPGHAYQRYTSDKRDCSLDSITSPLSDVDDSDNEGSTTVNEHVTPTKHNPSQRRERSAKIRACQRCSQRKIKCVQTGRGQGCRACAENRALCVLPGSSHRIEQSQALGGRLASSDAKPGQFGLAIAEDMAEDVDVVESFLSRQAGAVRPQQSSRLIVAVPRSRLTVLPASTAQAGTRQRLIIEQVLGPAKGDVVQLFIDHVHPFFAVIDRCQLPLKPQDTNAGDTLMCDVYAVACLFWSQSPALKRRHQPDTAFVWDQAVDALEEDWKAQSLQTLQAALLDLTGRPILGIMTNVTNMGRCVSLAYALGLHHAATRTHGSHDTLDIDPTAGSETKPTSQQTEIDQQLRTRIWWGVKIHDAWSSLAYGRPPLTDDRYSSVALPIETEDCRPFVALCKITQVLSRLLPLLHSEQNTLDSDLLEQWRSSLNIVHVSPDGDWSLRFCLEAVLIVFERVQYKVCLFMLLMHPRTDKPSADGDQNRRHWEGARVATLLSLSRRLKRLFQMLQDSSVRALASFWLPYTAHLLPTFVTLSMRCAIELSSTANSSCDYTHTGDECDTTRGVHGLRIAGQHMYAFWQWLVTAQSQHRWDVADLCVERCGSSVERFIRASSRLEAPRDAGPCRGGESQTQMQTTSDSDWEWEDQTALATWDGLFDFDLASVFSPPL